VVIDHHGPNQLVQQLVHQLVQQLGAEGRRMVESMVDRPATVVSLHWDWICDRLDRAGLRALQAATTKNLDAVNAAPVPGPGAAADRLG
jgi:hypothetical protein